MVACLFAAPRLTSCTLYPSPLVSRRASSVSQLELHEFFEAIVKLAFHRANPDFGDKGSTKEFVPQPLPDCLTSMLKDNLLLNAKRDALGEIKAQIGADVEAQAALRSQKEALRAKFERLAKSDTSAAAAAKKGAGGAQVSLERFSQEIFDLGLAKEVTVQPKSAVKGKTIPEVKTALTIIDAKGAFVTSQKIDSRSSSNATVNFEEFVMCIALCGTISTRHEQSSRHPPFSSLRVASSFATGTTTLLLREQYGHCIPAQALPHFPPSRPPQSTPRWPKCRSAKRWTG